LLIEIHLPDEAVLVALISGGTTVVVTCIRAAARVAIAWIQASHQRPPPGLESPSPEIEPPDP